MEILIHKATGELVPEDPYLVVGNVFLLPPEWRRLGNDYGYITERCVTETKRMRRSYENSWKDHVWISYKSHGGASLHVHKDKLRLLDK